MEKIVDNQKRFVPLAEYQRLSGLSFPTIKKALEVGQLKGIKTECGHWRVDTQAGNSDYSAVLDELKQQKEMLRTLLGVFGKA